MSFNSISVTQKNADVVVKNVEKTKEQKPKVNVPVGQSGNKSEGVTQEPKTGTYAASKINDVETRIAEKKLELVNASPQERAKLEKEIKELQQKKKSQDATAVLTENKDGNVQFKMKKDMNVEEFRKLFDIKEGVLSGNQDLDLEPEWKYYPKGSPDEGRQYQDWSNCSIDKGKTFTIPPSSINYKGAMSEFFDWMSH